MTWRLPESKDIEGAVARLGEKVRHTPTVVVHGDELGIPARVVLKLELLQHTGSFKARGALNSVMSLDPGAARVTAASGGNHGAAVAWAAQRNGLQADIFVPEASTPTKLERIQEYGATLHLVGGDVGDALRGAGLRRRPGLQAECAEDDGDQHVHDDQDDMSHVVRRRTVLTSG